MVLLVRGEASRGWWYRGEKARRVECKQLKSVRKHVTGYLRGYSVGMYLAVCE